MIAHEVMTRHGLGEAAALWEEEFTQRMAEQADEYPRGLRLLEGEHGMRMPAVADHLSERFVKPLAVNRMMALVRSSMTRGETKTETDIEAANESFAALRDEIRGYMEDRQGSGVEVPDWLQDLSDEADIADVRVLSVNEDERMTRDVRKQITREEIAAQLERWSEPLRVTTGSDARKRRSSNRED